MDLKILDSWLRDYLDSKVSPQKLGEYLSLCGPSVERVEKYGNDWLYDIEVTTNRIDTASVYGIAREAAAILPRFGVGAKLKEISTSDKNYTFTKSVPYIKAEVDGKLCSRFTAVLVKEVKVGSSPDFVVRRLESAGVRSINNVVDISNYIMLDLGQPVHTFDYDKIKKSQMNLRESKKGESITTLDGKTFKLEGGDIVIEDGEGRLIDLAGVMGGNLSMVDENTKNVLLFVQTYSPEHIRKTSMSLAQRTNAAAIFEKGLDTELVTPGILKAIELFKSLCKGGVESKILDLYPAPPKDKKVKVSDKFITSRLGIVISQKEISSYLNSLGIKNSWNGDSLTGIIPSYRQKDILDSEDLVEEIARIYGYHNLPSRIMATSIPDRSPSQLFDFEDRLKDFLSGFGGVEVYSLSLVSRSMAGVNALALKNPLGRDTEYLRTSLMPSLKSAALENSKLSSQFHIFEMANVYLPKKKDLPAETMILGGVFYGYQYNDAKGVVEALLQKININTEFLPSEESGFESGKMAEIKHNGQLIGKIGYLENSELVYYEFGVETLFTSHTNIGKYKPPSKFPAAIRDITFSFPEKTYIGNVLEALLNQKYVDSAELTAVYNGNHTFRIFYLDPSKNLTDEEANKINDHLIASVLNKFGGSVN